MPMTPAPFGSVDEFLARVKSAGDLTDGDTLVQERVRSAGLGSVIQQAAIWLSDRDVLREAASGNF